MNFTDVRKYVTRLLQSSFANKQTLDKLSTSEDGNLLFNGEEIKGGSGSVGLDIVNKDLDSCYCTLDTLFTPTVNSCVPFVKRSGNMTVSNGLITIKPGQRVEIGVCLSLGSTAGAGSLSCRIYDFTNNIEIGVINPLNDLNYYEFDKTCFVQYTNDTQADCQIGLKVVKMEKPDGFAAHSSLVVKEIGRAVVVDPVNYVNEENGIEDTPVGHILSFMGTTAPKHYLICDGTEYNISDYSILAEFIKNEFGAYNHFGGDGTTTFAVPDLRDRFLKGSTTAGISEDAGLPNISGNFNTYTYEGYADGTFSSVITNQNAGYGGANGAKYETISMSATNSNAIYGNSDTVTPTNTSILYCIKYEPTYCIAQTDISKQNKYSTDETIIGTWIDGRPIYRKVIQTVLPNHTAGDKTILDMPEVDYIVNMTGNSIRSTGQIQPFPYTYNDSTRTSIYLSPEKILKITNNYSGWNGNKVVIVLEYTKTTDTI